jgi:predicted DNA-binding protein YlxM (UPF0122 family)
MRSTFVQPDLSAALHIRIEQPILSDKQQKEPARMHAIGEYSISDLADLFSVSRPTVYRTLQRTERQISS